MDVFDIPPMDARFDACSPDEAPDATRDKRYVLKSRYALPSLEKRFNRLDSLYNKVLLHNYANTGHGATQNADRAGKKSYTIRCTFVRPGSAEEGQRCDWHVKACWSASPPHWHMRLGETGHNHGSRWPVEPEKGRIRDLVDDEFWTEWRKVTRKKNRHYRKRAGGVKLIKSRAEDAEIDPGRDRKQIEPRNPSERLGESEAGASQRAKRMRLGSATPEEMKRCDADDNVPEGDRLDFGSADRSVPPEDKPAMLDLTHDFDGSESGEKPSIPLGAFLHSLCSTPDLEQCAAPLGRLGIDSVRLLLDVLADGALPEMMAKLEGDGSMTWNLARTLKRELLRYSERQT